MEQKNITDIKRTYLNAKYSILSSFVLIVFGLVIQKFVIQYYGSEYNGFQSLASNIICYAMIIDGGISLTARKHLYSLLQKNDVKGIEKWSNFVFSGYKKISNILILFGAVISLVLPQITKYDYPKLEQSLIIFIIALKFFIDLRWNAPMQTMLDADQKSYEYFKYQLISRVVSSLIAVGVIVANMGIYFLLLSQMLQPIILTVFVYIKNKKYIPVIKQKVKIITQEFKYMIMNKVSGLILANVDILYVSIFSTLTMTSIYAIYSTISVGISTLASSISNAGMNQFGKKISNGENVNAEYNTYFVINIFITFISILGFIIVGPYIISFIGGEMYINKLYIVLFSSNLVFSQLRTTFNQMHYITDQYKRSGKMALFESFLNIALSTILVFVMKEDVITAVLIGTIATNLWRLIYDVRLNVKHIVGDRRTYFKTIASILISVAIFFVYWLVFNDYSLSLTFIINSACLSLMAITVLVLFNFRETKWIIAMGVSKIKKNKTTNLH